MTAPATPLTRSRLVPGEAVRTPLRVVITGGRGPGITEEARRLRSILEARGHSVESRLGDDPPPQPPCGDPATKPDGRDDHDLVVVLGGDGSILRTAHWMGYRQRPALGVNLGTLGFLAHLAPEEFEAALGQILEGRFRLVGHLMFECEVVRDGAVVHRRLGLNETSILAGPPFSMIEVSLVVDGEPATTYRGDGLIVSTPVGSTAHSLSAGGPILREDLDVFLFTPLAPHTLTNRPVVDSASRGYELVVPRPNAGTSCVVDGRVVSQLSAGDRVRIRRAEPVFTLLETGNQHYYRTLREKLDWGGGLRAVAAKVARSLLVGLCLLGGRAVGDEGDLWLRYAFRPGETLTMAVEHRAVTDTTIAGQRQSVETATDSRKIWKVLEVDADGNATLEHSVDDMKASSRSSDRGELRWRSGDGTAPPPGYEGAAENLGRPLSRIVVDAFGRVLERHDLRQVAAGNTGDFLIVPLPDHPVRPGDEWSVPQEIVVEVPNGPRKAVKTRLRYRLAGVRDGLADIDVDTTVLTPIDDPRLEARLLERIWDGRILFDVVRGRIDRRTTGSDRRVVGFSGPDSSIHYRAKLEERLLEQEPGD